MELDNISHRQMTPQQPATNFRSTGTNGEQILKAGLEVNATEQSTQGL
jgi:hypothetical protein